MLHILQNSMGLLAQLLQEHRMLESQHLVSLNLVER